MTKKNKIISKNKLSKLAFTLTEVVVATFISTIVLSFIFIFVSDISDGIIETRNEVRIMESFYDFTYKLNNYRNLYTSGGILVDNTSTGSDIFLMRDESGENGLLLGSIDLSNNKINTDNSIYEDNGVGFRKLSSIELIEIDTDINFVYDYIFNNDNIFPDLKMKDLNIVSYNSGLIHDLYLTVNTDFQNSLVGQSWDDLPKNTLTILNIDF